VESLEKVPLSQGGAHGGMRPHGAVLIVWTGAVPPIGGRESEFSDAQAASSPIFLKTLVPDGSISGLQSLNPVPALRLAPHGF